MNLKNIFNNSGWLSALFDLIIHIFIGAAAFLVILIVAVGLEWSVKIIFEFFDVENSIIKSIVPGIKSGLFFVDIFLGGVFILAAGSIFCKRMLNWYRSE